jgi:3-deoxy-D-manno-octulosonic-acid transferase
MLTLYQSLLGFGLVFFLPFWLPLALLFKRTRSGLRQRFGILPKECRPAPGERRLPVLWVHAASLGEVEAMGPLVRQLMKDLPGEKFFFTCTTLAGRTRAKEMFPAGLAHLLLPLDLPIFLKPWLRAFPPKLLLLAETEVWPSFLKLVKRERGLILVANGRLTERSARRYRRTGSLFTKALQCVDCLAMQSEDDAARVLALGVKAQRVLVAGNTKFDRAPSVTGAKTKEQWRQELGLEVASRLLVAGSTRPGDEKWILPAFRGLHEKMPGLKLLLAPRHLERLPEVEKSCRALGLRTSRRSAVPPQPAEVILLDTLGELAQLYALASAAVVGGSFRHFGGQNPLEPAAAGVPVVFGPDMRHFKEPAAALVQAGAARQLRSPAELNPVLMEILAEPSRAAAMGQAGQQVCRERRGASQRLADLAQKMLLIGELKSESRENRIQFVPAAPEVQEFGRGRGEDPGNLP